MSYGGLSAIADATKNFAIDLIGGRIFTRAKVTFGAEGEATDVSAATPLPVAVTKAAPVYVDHSGQIAVGGTAVTAMAGNLARRVLWVQNASGFDLRVNELGAASETAGILLSPGNVVFWEDGTAPLTGISIWGGTTGQRFVARQA